MKTKLKRISKTTIGLISTSLFTVGVFALWEWRNISNYAHEMVQVHPMMTYGSNLWGLFLAIGVVLLVGFSTLSMIGKAENQKINTTLSCSKCSEDLLNTEWEFCPTCGKPTRPVVSPV
jgi:hypothetical protein